jgi:DNA helicase-2/ATP-dependent DNA helicase PcrA
MEYAQLILPRYLSSRKEQWLPEENVETEVGFKNLEFEGIPIRGQIDKIVRKVNQLTVVDYKTGKYDNAKNKMDPPLPSDKLKETERDHNKIKGGDYWRQLYFYKIMLDSDRHFEEEVVSGILDFVEPVNGEFPLEVLHFSHEEEEMVKSQLREVYHKIKNAEFSIGCDKEDCEWCNFNKYYLHENHSVSKDLLKADVDEMEER